MGLFDILFGDPRPKKCDGYTINNSDPYWSLLVHFMDAQLIKQLKIIHCAIVQNVVVCWYTRMTLII